MAKSESQRSQYIGAYSRGNSTKKEFKAARIHTLSTGGRANFSDKGGTVSESC